MWLADRHDRLQDHHARAGGRRSACRRGAEPADDAGKCRGNVANGTGANVIINQINNTGSVFQLTVEQIGYLKQQGVNDAVIEYMQTHHAGAVVGSAPPPPPAYVRPAAYAVYPYPAYAYPGPYVYPYGGCYVRGGYYCR